MPKSDDSLKDRLARYREINVTVIGRKSGKPSTRPVWFVAEGDTLFLLPVQGSETQWYKNVLDNPTVQIDARGATGEFQAVPISETKPVAAVAEKFRQKYGADDVKKYYSKFDVAVVVPLH